MNKLSILLVFLAVLVISIFNPKQSKPSPLDADLALKVQTAADNVDHHLMLNATQKGTAVLFPSNEMLSEQYINDIVSSQATNPDRAAYLLLWGAQKTKTSEHQNRNILSAMGRDYKHHFANSYLVGFRPFAVENNWLPLYVLAHRKVYQTDTEQYGALDIWQNSAQAYVNLRGDCEDHAILLADWLISEGIDARVVGGKHMTSGHAWVVAITEQGQFLLEATDKSAYKSWTHYPLTSLTQGYKPKYMFNRDKFWINTGNENTTDYVGKHWQQTAKFVKAANDTHSL